MALNSGKILMRRGQEANFDPNKMMPGEWAVSLDSKYVRMCFSPGVCIRMATYEAFEADMEQIRQILAECESIEQAVSLINTEVSQNAEAVVEYTKEAKQYRDEAKQYRDEAFSTTPDGYDSLVGQVNKNTVAISTIVEKAELNIKETAMGENIHLIDSADGKNVEFALYGKATQDGTPTPQNLQEIEVSGESYNLLENTATSKTINGVTFTVNEDKSVTANGTATAQITFDLIPRESAMFTDLIGEELILSGCPIGGGQNIYQLQAFTTGFTSGATDRGSGLKFALTDSIAYAYITIFSGVTVDNVTFKPMIRKASVKNDRYIPYGKGSVEVKSTGKNKMVLDQSLNTDSQSFTYSSNTQELISATVNRLSKFIATFKTVLRKGKTYTISINASRGLAINFYSDKIWGNSVGALGVKDNKTFTFDGESGEYIIGIYADSSSTIGEVISLSNLQLEEGPVATPYEPYKETLSTIPTENGLAGIPVDSGGNYTDSNGQQWIANEIVKYADGSGEKIQRIGKEIFDGSEDEAWYRDNRGRWISNIVKNSIKVNTVVALCNSYQVKTASQTYEKNIGIGVDDDGSICVYDSEYEESDVATWNENLSTNNVVFYYELAEPIRTPLTAEEIAEIEKLQTFKPVTNISNDGGCGMKVKYIVDPKNYIDNRLNLIERAILNSI